MISRASADLQAAASLPHVAEQGCSIRWPVFLLDKLSKGRADACADRGVCTSEIMYDLQAVKNQDLQPRARAHGQLLIGQIS